MKLRRSLLITLSLFLVTMALYSRSAYFPFCIIDDSAYVTDNIHVTSGLTIDSIAWALTAFHAGNWHPVTWLSLMLDFQLFGLNPMGFHLVNALIHALNASLLFLLLRSTTGAVWRSAFVAVCFAFHPLHVESVAWIAERKDVLSALFWILTLIFYGSYAKEGRRIMYLLSLAAFALGLMAKPMLVTIPFVLLLMDYWPLERLKIRPFFRSEPDSRQQDYSSSCHLSALLLEKVPFLLLAAGCSILTLYAQKSGISSLTNVPLLERGTNALWVLLAYVVKMVFPIDLAIIYPLVRLPLWKAGFAAAVISVTTFMVMRYMCKYRYLATGWFWYLITLLPVIGIIQVGRQAMADRYTYLPLIGLFIMVSWGGAELSVITPKLKNLVSVTASGIVLCLFLVTWGQLGYWRENMNLVRHTLEVTESGSNYYAHYLLGMLHEKRGRPDLAIEEYIESVRIEPRDPIIHFDLGFILEQNGRTAEAITQYREALTLDPGYAQAHFTLGILLGNIGKIEESITEFREALKIEPENPKFLNNCGIALAQKGMLDEAIELFSRAVQVNPRDEKASENLQIALQQRRLLSGK